MKYKIEIRPFSTAIVAWDVESPERHQAIRNYIQDELDGIERGESVFEIQYAQQATVWRAIYERFKAILDPKEDVMYIWDQAKPKGAIQRRLFLTTLP